MNRLVKPDCSKCDFCDEIINEGLPKKFCIAFRKYCETECFLLKEELVLKPDIEYQKDQLSFLEV